MQSETSPKDLKCPLQPFGIAARHYKAGPLCNWLLHKGPVFRFCPGEGHDLLLREGSMSHGRDALAARFTRAWSAKCGRAPYPNFFEATGVVAAPIARLSHAPARSPLSAPRVASTGFWCSHDAAAGLAVLAALKCEFRSTPINGHRQTGPVGLVRAKERHRLDHDRPLKWQVS
jgi:hypothetical protein